MPGPGRGCSAAGRTPFFRNRSASPNSATRSCLSGKPRGEVAADQRNRRDLRRSELFAVQGEQFGEETHGAPPTTRSTVILSWKSSRSGWANRSQKKVEPQSGLGEAIRYMQKRWEPLTLFLRYGVTAVPASRMIQPI